MTDKGYFIAALPAGDVVTFLVLVKDKEIRPKRAGGWYLHILLCDRTGEIEAKVWQNPQETAALFERDDIVKVRGSVELYNDRRQLIVQRIRRCEEGEFNEADFCATSSSDPEELFAELSRFVDSIEEDQLRSLLLSIVDDPDLVPKLKGAPGGVKIHHGYRGGLLEHMVSVCALVDQVLAHYLAAYPRLNRDWIIAGAILHDIGKVEELGGSRRLAYTTRGQLVGHVALGLELLERHVASVKGFPLEMKTLLQHLIVSHHGVPEKGALRAPAFPEAIVLHALDDLDARLNQACGIIEQTQKGEEWTAYVPALGRQLYCGRNGHGTSAECHSRG